MRLLVKYDEKKDFYSQGNFCLDTSFHIYFFSVLFLLIPVSLFKQTRFLSVPKISECPLNPQKVGMFLALLFFQKCVFQRRVKPCFFVTFNLFISRIFPILKFIKIPRVVQKILRFSSSVLTILTGFSVFLTVPCCKENNDVTYNR